MNIIRSMAEGDLEAVVALDRCSPGAPHWDRYVYEVLLRTEKPVAALVALESDTLQGFVVMSLILDICEIESVVVAAEFRRKGIGAALLEAVTAWARRHSARRVELEVRAGNTPAIALYERAGFARDGLRRGYYRHPDEDALLMSLALSS